MNGTEFLHEFINERKWMLISSELKMSCISLWRKKLGLLFSIIWKAGISFTAGCYWTKQIPSKAPNIPPTKTIPRVPLIHPHSNHPQSCLKGAHYMSYIMWRVIICVKLHLQSECWGNKWRAKGMRGRAWSHCVISSKLTSEWKLDLLPRRC